MTPVPAQKEEILRLQALAFRGRGSGKPLEEFREIWDSDPRHSNACSRALWEKGKMASYLRYAPWGAYVRGQAIPLGGLAEVCTHPKYRGRGHIRLLVDEILRDHPKRGFHLNMLYGDERHYHRYGWAVSADFAVLERDISQMEFPKAAGSLRRARWPQDLKVLSRLYKDKAVNLPQMVVRDRRHWLGRINRKSRNLMLALDSKGRALGYGLWSYHSKPRRIHFLEICGTEEAQWALAGHARRDYPRAKSLSTRWGWGLAPPPLWDGRGLSTEVWYGPMARLVGLKEFLKSLSPGLGRPSGHLKLQLHDPMGLSGTHGLWSLGPGGSCRPAKGSPDARTDVGSLTQLILGYRGAMELAALGKLESRSKGLQWLDRCFPKAPGYQEELDAF